MIDNVILTPKTEKESIAIQSLLFKHHIPWVISNYSYQRNIHGRMYILVRDNLIYCDPIDWLDGRDSLVIAFDDLIEMLDYE